MKVKTKKQARIRRHFRIRKKLSGTENCPRLAIFLSNKHIYAQVINDEIHQTLVQASTREKDRGSIKPNRETAALIGKEIGERAKGFGIQRVVFDRGGFAYGLKMKAIADAAREAGLRF